MNTLYHEQICSRLTEDKGNDYRCLVYKSTPLLHRILSALDIRTSVNRMGFNSNFSSESKLQNVEVFISSHKAHLLGFIGREESFSFSKLLGNIKVKLISSIFLNFSRHRSLRIGRLCEEIVIEQSCWPDVDELVVVDRNGALENLSDRIYISSYGGTSRITYHYTSMLCHKAIFRVQKMLHHTSYHSQSFIFADATQNRKISIYLPNEANTVESLLQKNICSHPHCLVDEFVLF